MGGGARRVRARADDPRGARRRPCAPTGRDLLELAAWATARGTRARASSSTATCARYAATLSERRLAKSTIARKLAAVRGLHTHLVDDRRRRVSNPADLLPAHEARARACRGCSAATRSPTCSTGSRRAPRSRSATGRCSSSPTRAGCAPRRSSRSTSADSTSSPRRCASPARARKTRLVPIGEPAQAALRRYLDAARHALGPARDEPALFVSRRGRRLSASDVRRRLDKWVREAAVAGTDLAAHAAPFVCDPPARGRGRPALDPGAARALECLDDADLHTGRAVAAAAGVRKVPPACLNRDARVAFPRTGTEVRID